MKATKIPTPPVCALTAQIASICISNIDLQQFFTREPHSNSFVTRDFTTEKSVEPDGSTQSPVPCQERRLELSKSCPHAVNAEPVDISAIRRMGRLDPSYDTETAGVATPASKVFRRFLGFAQASPTCVSH